jgi:hypothetical protein
MKESHVFEKISRILVKKGGQHLPSTYRLSDMVGDEGGKEGQKHTIGGEKR